RSRDIFELAIAERRHAFRQHVPPTLEHARPRRARDPLELVAQLAQWLAVECVDRRPQRFGQPREIAIEGICLLRTSHAPESCNAHTARSTQKSAVVARSR